MYFSLKDDRAQISCALFRSRGGGSRGSRTEVPVANGLKVLARGRVSIYEPRGAYQLIVEHLEPAGEGLLRRRLEELKQRLAAEGLFDEARKQELPRLPRRIGVVTSPSGAAIRDVLQILKRRFPAIPVLIYPVQVQGEQAKFDIVNALESAARRAECDVLIVARGGGSLEDLWAFNEEMVARAIAACPIPVVSGVGHEVDVTIADLVADLRAPTPSGAAELVVPDSHDWLRRVEKLERDLKLAVSRRWIPCSPHGAPLRPAWTAAILVFSCVNMHNDWMNCGGQLALALRNRLALDRLRIHTATARLRALSPATRIAIGSTRVATARQRLASALRSRLAVPATRLAVLSGRFAHGESPQDPGTRLCHCARRSRRRRSAAPRSFRPAITSRPALPSGKSRPPSDRSSFNVA
ncbi:MAG: exodeoxyribonuclease VII large subunit [Gammaproteobacteria bacterium]